MPFYPNHQRESHIPKHLPEGVVNELSTAKDLYIQVQAKPHFINTARNAYRTTLERALCELVKNNKHQSIITVHFHTLRYLQEEGQNVID